MPSQFTPSEPNEVLDVVASQDHIHDATRVGDGILAVRNRTTDQTHVLDGLTRNHGWRLVMYDKNDSGDLCLYMPITEVPE